MSDTPETSTSPPATQTEATGEITRPVMVRLNEDGTHSAESVLTPENMQVRAECHLPSRLVIPVIFLPGIMGTRLKVKGTEKTKAWFPPESMAAGLIQVLKDLGWNAAARQRLLDPDNTEVDDTGPAEVPSETAVRMGDVPGDSREERSKQRGWGQLHADSYQNILNVLEQRLSNMMYDGCKPSPAWSSAVMDWQQSKQSAGIVRTGAERFGALKDFKPIDDGALRCAASAFYPVHAVGYNWLQSNKQSGEHLSKEIDRIVAYYSGRKKVCEKVILVTHSMGGFVARVGMQVPGAQSKILGVVHGVQPAIGAPAVYKRMRAGFEGPEQVILGRDAAEATAVLANAPGPLELLPTRQYKTKSADGVKRHWLRASHSAAVQAGMEKADTSTSLGEADIYNDIYLNNKADSWWRMVMEELIDPAGQQEQEKARREGKEVVEENAKRSDFVRFAKSLDKARVLHDHIEDKYHPVTYAYYAADEARRSWSEVQWKCSKPVELAYLSAELVADNQNGEVKIRVGEHTFQFAIQKQGSPGDGTVPAESGEAPLPYVVQMFKHEGKAKGHDSYDHQGSYSAAVAQATTMYSIARMAADSEWLKLHMDKA